MNKNNNDNYNDIYVEISPAEQRIAKVDSDGLLNHFTIERMGNISLVGGIYLGLVRRIEKSMSAAFIDIGIGENGMINNAKTLHEGQWLIVQVTKDAHDNKGVTLSKNITLLGRYLGYTPSRSDLNWARSIGKGKARAELEGILSDISENDDIDMAGYAIRSAATMVDAKILIAEFNRLGDEWNDIKLAAKTHKARLLVAPVAMVEKILRDGDKNTRLAIDDRQIYLQLKKLIVSQMPDQKHNLAFYDAGNNQGLFEDAGIDEQLEDGLAVVVELSGGGSLIFEHTQAMNVIDVNMGKGSRHGDDAVFKVNVKAAKEICRQISLRNLSGLIVIDFISMKNKGRAKKIVEIMRANINKINSGNDNRHVDILGLSAAGLVEITRQRQGVTLGEQMLNISSVKISPHPLAQGAAILRAAMKLKGAGTPVAYGSTLVIEGLKGELSTALNEASRRLGRQLMLRIGEDSTPPIVEMEI